jgi:hypothetical protein
MSFIVDDAVWTSTRLLQGQTDAVFMFKNGMTKELGDLLEHCTLLWVDDIFHDCQPHKRNFNGRPLVILNKLKTHKILYQITWNLWMIFS